MNKQDKKEIMNLIKYKKMLGGRRMENKQTKELLKLIQENPELPLVFLVYSEDLADDYEYRYTMIKDYRASVETIWLYQDHYYDHIVDITEAVEEDLINEEEYENLSNEEFDKAVEKYIEEEVESFEAIAVCL
jgi:hypothetical protein